MTLPRQPGPHLLVTGMARNKALRHQPPARYATACNH